MPYSDDELRKRIETLERIVVAMASGAKFTITLDEQGRPQIWTEIPPEHLRNIVSK